MSNAQIDAILRALGSSSVDNYVGIDGYVRSARANDKAAASASAEASLVHLTPVPDRLLDLSIERNYELEQSWLLQSELKGARTFKRCACCSLYLQLSYLLC